MNRNLFYIVSLVFLVGVLLMTACTPPAAPQPEAPAVEAPAADAPAATECNVPAPAAPTTINYIGWEMAVTTHFAAEMEKCSEVENLTVVARLPTYDEASAAVALAQEVGGAAPNDILHGSNPEMASWGATDGYLLPLNDLIDKYRDQYDLDDIPQVAWDGATFDGKIYGIPFFSNTLHLFYRSDLLEKHGLSVPTNYDEVIAACKVLADDPSITVPFVFDVSADWAWDIEYLAFLKGFGVNYLNDDNTPGWDSPEGVAALTKMKEVVDACMGPDGLTLGYEAAVVALKEGTVAMSHMWANMETDFGEGSENVKYAPAPAPVPGGPLGGSAWNDFYGIAATTKHDPELVFLVLMESLDLESMQAGAATGAVTRGKVETALANGAAINETVANGVGYYPAVTGLSYAQAALYTWLPFVGTGELSPQEALDNVTKDYYAAMIEAGLMEAEE